MLKRLNIFNTTYLILAFILAFSVKVWADPSDPETEQKINILNWSDYIGPHTIDRFETRTGIKVSYNVTDSNELIEVKLISGKSGYDLAFPSAYPSFQRLIQTGAIQKINKKLVPNWANLDPKMMKLLHPYDPNNDYGIIYHWGTIGLGVNPDMILKVDPKANLNSLDMILDEQHIKKISKCGIAMLNSPIEILPTVAHYYGIELTKITDQEIEFLQEKLAKIRPYITYFTENNYIQDLASGDICLALGFSGGVITAKRYAALLENDITINYVVPKEGSEIYFDLMVLPKDAPNIENAHAFVNYILEPSVIAEISDHVKYPNAVPTSVQKLLKLNPSNEKLLYSEADFKNLFISMPIDKKRERKLNRLWTRFMYNY